MMMLMMMIFFHLGRTRHIFINGNIDVKNIFIRKTNRSLTPLGRPSYAMRERERNVLFNDALNTFYLRLYGVRHMVKDHSDSERGNPLPPHRLPYAMNCTHISPILIADSHTIKQ